jgi:uncharacterized protein YlxW (UPF0749 family)
VLPSGATAEDADALLPVDCLLPGQIRKLGSRTTYLTPRRPLKTTATDCELRGGEYVDYDRASYETALRVWLPDAQAGDARAQNYVGEIYEKGLGVAPDPAAAALWYRRAAEQGLAAAMLNLGQLHELGAGVALDPELAVSWYRRAAEAGAPGVVFVAAAAPDAGETDALRAELASQRATLAALRDERDALQRTLSARTQALDAAQSDVLARRQELDAARAALGAERARLDAERAALERERGGDDTARAEVERARAALAEREREVAALESSVRDEQLAARRERESLAATQQELAGKQAAVDAAARELERERAKLATEAAAQPAPAPEVPVAGPSIELIEPPLGPATRGVAIVESLRGDRMIVGRVSAPAGLLALTLNGSPLAADERGLFRATVQVPASGMEVALGVVDRQGKRGERRVRLAPSVPRAAAPARPEPPKVSFGRFHALVIGNDGYRRLPRLSTAEADARAIGEVLRARYGFVVRTLIDADRYAILSALNELRAQLAETDNLLVYYAGHGELDEVNARGHWLPVDAEPDSSANWISNVAISDVLNAMSARRVLVIADSCYSGTLTRSSLASLDAGASDEARAAWLRALASKRSRTALTSGGLAPVLDGGGAGHSVFANALIDALQRNGEVLEGQRLHQAVAARVAYAAENLQFEQAPQYAPIKFAGHEAGDFVFVPSTEGAGR